MGKGVMRLRYWFLFFLVWFIFGLVFLFLGGYYGDMGDHELAFQLTLLTIITLGTWVFVGLPTILFMVIDFLRVSARAPKTLKSFLKECPKCGKEIPIASEECPYCKSEVG